MRKLLVILFLLLALLPMPSRLIGQSRDSFRDRYGLLSDRDIFSRDRRRPYSRPSEAPFSRPSFPSSSAQRSPEQSLMLTGIVIEEGEMRAYFENLGAGSLVKVRIGDPVARGHVTSMQIDAIEYTQGLQSTWVEIGRDLTGVRVEASATIASVPVTSGSATQPSGGASSPGPLPNPNDPNLTLEERMRLRRQMLSNPK